VREAERRSMRQRAALNVDVPPYWLEQQPRPDYVEVELERTSEEFRLQSTSQWAHVGL